MSLSFQLRRPIRFDAYTIEEALTHILVSEVAKRRPSFIVEFGSGLSTVLIAKVIDVVGFESRFVSFEEDERYLKRTQAWLKAEGLEGRAQVIHAPVVSEDGHPAWYRDREFDRLFAMVSPTDTAFVLVDGPVTRDELHHVRWPGLALTSWLWMQPGGAALVAGTKRDPLTVARWKMDFPEVQWTELDTERGALLLEPPAMSPTDDEDAIASAA